MVDFRFNELVGLRREVFVKNKRRFMINKETKVISLSQKTTEHLRRYWRVCNGKTRESGIAIDGVKD